MLYHVSLTSQWEKMTDGPLPVSRSWKNSINLGSWSCDTSMYSFTVFYIISVYTQQVHMYAVWLTQWYAVRIFHAMLYCLCGARSGLSQYHIVGNYWGRKLSQIGKKWPFRGKSFHRMLKLIIYWWVWCAQILWRKFSQVALKQWNSVNIFSLKSFPLAIYSNYGRFHGACHFSAPSRLQSTSIQQNMMNPFIPQCMRVQNSN